MKHKPKPRSRKTQTKRKLSRRKSNVSKNKKRRKSVRKKKAVRKSKRRVSGGNDDEVIKYSENELNIITEDINKYINRNRNRYINRYRISIDDLKQFLKLQYYNDNKIKLTEEEGEAYNNFKKILNDYWLNSKQSHPSP